MPTYRTHDAGAGSDRRGRASITREALALMLADCRRRYPAEACGALACSRPDEGPLANRLPEGCVGPANAVYPIRNAALSSGKTFAFDPSDWIRTVYGIQKNRQSLAGIYHSHPRTEPVPSAADLAGLRYLKADSYWIISLANPAEPHIQAYRLQDGRLLPLMLAEVSV
ncbi:M67 family metallopeptidase [Paenibacillus humicola]|uniref:M67 family metallopeptidase n=1 Tax=Paenibacillus humicola TaxID=3110540 RepID=UPI00237A431A|nr:M67 family metallopeptidase [Paenibacillus humicola]